MENNKLLETILQEIKTIKADVSEIKDRTQKIEGRTQNIEERTQRIEDRTQQIEERTLKIEVTIENETNRNIMLMMEAQSMNAQKLKDIDITLDDIESSVIATEAITMQNIRDIKTLKKKAQ